MLERPPDVSVWESDADQLGRVKEFVAAMGSRMDYNVAFDGAKKAMSTDWMVAAKQRGIPVAFSVKDGKILWIGYPTVGLDEAIEQTLKGTFDVAANAKFDASSARFGALPAGTRASCGSGFREGA